MRIARLEAHFQSPEYISGTARGRRILDQNHRKEIRPDCVFDFDHVYSKDDHPSGSEFVRGWKTLNGSNITDFARLRQSGLMIDITDCRCALTKRNAAYLEILPRGHESVFRPDIVLDYNALLASKSPRTPEMWKEFELRFRVKREDVPRVLRKHDPRVLNRMSVYFEDDFEFRRYDRADYPAGLYADCLTFSQREQLIYSTCVRGRMRKIGDQ